MVASRRAAASACEIREIRRREGLRRTERRGTATTRCSRKILFRTDIQLPVDAEHSRTDAPAMRGRTVSRTAAATQQAASCFLLPEPLTKKPTSASSRHGGNRPEIDFVSAASVVITAGVQGCRFDDTSTRRMPTSPSVLARLRLIIHERANAARSPRHFQRLRGNFQPGRPRQQFPREV